MLGIFAAALALQAGASLLVRTHAMRLFLIRQLEDAFGRPVEVQNFAANLFPTPQIDAYGISVGEDPSFGHEYFLRAERLSAGLRWTGFLAGRFELGTLQLSRPSLILVRNGEGRWNLERWLPAAAPAGRVVQPTNFKAPAPPLQRLRKIDIDDGRVNFKSGDEKVSFAFVQVKGNLEQVSIGRWQLDLESQPWRSGVPLQLAGTVRVRGDVAGTSNRLQPAHLRVRWEKSSLADVFRLIGGRDFGVRGSFAGEAAVESSPDQKNGVSGDASGDWQFSVDARAGGIHRWDLTERDDNPRVGVHIKGRWNPGLGVTEAREVTIEAPRSNFRGRARLTPDSDYLVELRLDSAGFQAADFMEWYRAFQPDVAESIRGEQYFTGSATFRGWPLRIEEVAFSSRGGSWSIPGISAPVSVRVLRGGTRRGELIVEPFVVTIPAIQSPSTKGDKVAVSGESAAPGLINVSLEANLAERTGNIHLEGQMPQLESALVLASAFGRNVRYGWDLKGRAAGELRWAWTPGQRAGWLGHADLSRASLQVAGLNQPVTLDSLRGEWGEARRKFTFDKVRAFDADWSGFIEQAGAPSGTDFEAASPWTFQLQADHLDAADLDRWIGPRARPNWLQRLLPSAMTDDLQGAASSAVLKRIRAQGDLKAEEVTMERIKLKAFRAHVDVDAAGVKVTKAQAQWAGGTVQGNTLAQFSASPRYEVTASFNGVSLAQTPWLARLSDRVAGIADGSIELRASGIGREDLLKNLAGKGDLQLSGVELRGWDLAGSMEQGDWKTGVSRWASGTGTFHLNDGDFELNGLKLNGAAQEFLLKGSISFAQDADLRAESHVTGRAPRSQPSVRFMTISGPLSKPRISLEKETAQQPGD